MPRRGEEPLGLGLLDYPAEVKDDHAVGDVADDVEVVCHHHHSEPEPLSEAAQEVQDLALD